jgi:hypothetical protein
MGTLITSGTSTFQVNDILRIKDELNDEWMLVTGVTDASHYTVTRDLAGNYTANNNPAWSKGATIVNYGQSDEGGLILTSSLANSPYLSIFTHSGSPWSDLTERARLGNLTGIADTTGYGLWTDNCYLTGRLQTGSGNKKIVADSSDNTLRFYDKYNNLVMTLDDTFYMSVGADEIRGGIQLNEGMIFISGTDTGSIFGASTDYSYLTKNTLRTGVILSTVVSIASSQGFRLLISGSSTSSNRVYSLPDMGADATFDLTVPSDKRLKENIVPTKYGLNIIKTVKIVDFNFISDTNKIERTGAIAQEVQEFYPQIVNQKEDGYLEIKYKEFIPVIIKSIQELNDRVTKLEKENKDLKKQVANLSMFK